MKAELKTVLISAITFTVLSIGQYIFFDSDVLQTLSDKDAKMQAGEFISDICIETDYRVLVFPNHSRVPDYGSVYDCEGYFNR